VVADSRTKPSAHAIEVESVPLVQCEVRVESVTAPRLSWQALPRSDQRIESDSAEVLVVAGPMVHVDVNAGRATVVVQSVDVRGDGGSDATLPARSWATAVSPDGIERISMAHATMANHSRAMAASLSTLPPSHGEISPMGVGTVVSVVAGPATFVAVQLRDSSIHNVSFNAETPSRVQPPAGVIGVDVGGRRVPGTWLAMSSAAGGTERVTVDVDNVDISDVFSTTSSSVVDISGR